MNKSKKFNSGFTLIELLVVIAIIGILASVVLAALGSARNKGKDAAIESEISSIRSQAEIYASSATPQGSYDGLFTGNNTWASTSAGVQSILDGISAQTTTHTAGSSASAWAAEAQLPSTLTGTASYFCADSTGKSGVTSNALNAGDTVCP